MPQRVMLNQPYLGAVLATTNHTFKSAVIINSAFPQPANVFASGQASVPSVYSSIDVITEITAISGTSAAITVQLYGCNDGVNFVAIGAATASLTATGDTVLSNTNVDYTFLQVWIVMASTTTPSATVNVNVLGF